MPVDYKLYPKNWKTSIRPAILKRAGNCCEFCGVRDHTYLYRPRTQRLTKIILTVAHLDHDIHNNDGMGPGGPREGKVALPLEDSNLAALCQKCHNTYDAHKRAQSRIRNRRKRLEKAGQLRLSSWRSITRLKAEAPSRVLEDLTHSVLAGLSLLTF